MDSPNSPGLLKRFWDFISSPNYRRTVSVLGILVLAAAVPLTVFIAQRQQELRQRASTDGTIEIINPATGQSFTNNQTTTSIVFLKVTLPNSMAYSLPNGWTPNPQSQGKKLFTEPAFAQSAITVFGTASCGPPDSRIIWTWSGGSGRYTRLGLRNDTTGQFDFYTPSFDQTTFVSTGLPENNRFRLQVFDDSGEDGLSPFITSLSCGPASTPTPMPTATSTPHPACSSYTNCNACISASRDCGWDGGNCREGNQACPANETFWFFRSCSINECTEAPPQRTPPPPTPTPSCIEWDPINCSSAVSPGRCTDYGVPGYCNWGEELRFACRDRCDVGGTSNKQPLKQFIVENIDGGSGGHVLYTRSDGDGIAPSFQEEKLKLINGNFYWELNTNPGPKRVKITFTDVNNNTKTAESQEVTLSVGASEQGQCSGNSSNASLNKLTFSCGPIAPDNSLTANWNVTSVGLACNIYIRGEGKDYPISTDCTGTKQLPNLNGDVITNDGIYELWISNGGSTSDPVNACLNRLAARAVLNCTGGGGGGTPTVCSQYTNCTNCTNAQTCGWADGSRCISGTSNTICPAGVTTWAFNRINCNAPIQCSGQPTATPIPPPGATATPVPTPIPPPGATATPVPTPTATIGPTSTPIPTPHGDPFPTATPIPTPTATIGPTSTPIPGGVQVAITLKLQGIGGTAEKTNPIRPQRTVTVQFFNQGNTKIAEQSGLVTYNGFSGTFNGTIDMNLVPAGSYAVKAKMSGYLTKLIQPVLQITNAGQYPISGTPQIIGGDMNGDNALDVLDYSLFVRCFGARADTPSCSNKQIADIDDNGRVEGIDYQLFVKGLSIHLGD